MSDENELRYISMAPLKAEALTVVFDPGSTFTPTDTELHPPPGIDPTLLRIDPGLYWVKSLLDDDVETVAEYDPTAFYGAPGWFLIGSDYPVRVYEVQLLSSSKVVR